MRSKICQAVACLRDHLKARYLIPDLESARTFPAVFLGAEPMPTWAEMLANWSEGGQEALGMVSGLEAAHRPLALSRRLMRVFGTIVQPFVLAMLDTRHDFRLGCLVAAELVRDQHARDVGAALRPRGTRFAEEFLRRRLVPPTLNKDIKNIPVLVNRAPEIGRLAVDLRKTSSRCHLSPVLARRRRS